MFERLAVLVCGLLLFIIASDTVGQQQQPITTNARGQVYYFDRNGNQLPQEKASEATSQVYYQQQQVQQQQQFLVNTLQQLQQQPRWLQLQQQQQQQRRLQSQQQQQQLANNNNVRTQQQQSQPPFKILNKPHIYEPQQQQNNYQPLAASTNDKPEPKVEITSLLAPLSDDEPKLGVDASKVKVWCCGPEQDPCSVYCSTGPFLSATALKAAVG